MSQYITCKDLTIISASEHEQEVVDTYIMKKKSRRGTKKSRSGCVTCKIRRIKCDEGRPTCLNCTKTGRQCDQYDTTENSLEPIKSTLWNKLNSTTPTTIIELSTNRVHDLSSCSVEVAHLDLFQSIATTLCSISDMQFWREDVLRNLNERPATTSAAIAFGAYYRIFQIDEQRLGNDLEALKLYQKSIQNVNWRLSTICKDGYSENGLQDIMVATILLVCIDLLRHEHLKANTHLHGGLLLFSKYFTHVQDRLLCPTSLSIRKVFQKLEWQASLYIGTRTIHYPTSLLTELSSLKFSSLSEASETLDSIALSTEIIFIPPHSEQYSKEKIDPFFRGVELEPQDEAYNVFHGTMYRDYPNEVPLWQRTKFQDKLEAWKRMFIVLCMDETRADTSQNDLTGIAQMWMLYHTTYIKLRTFYSGREVDYDKHLDNFQAIIDQAKIVLEADPKISLSPSTPPHLQPLYPKNSFVLHTGFTYPLYFTALKCRERSLRRQAISLLAKTKVEGVWVPSILAGVAKFLMHDEETSAANGTHLGDNQQYFGIPELYRAHCFIVNIGRCSKTVKVKYSKAITELYDMNHGRVWELHSRSFSWN